MTDTATAPETAVQSHHGTPCWFELMTPDLAAAGRFYAAILPWTIADSGMQGFTYHLARAGETMVAGLMAPDEPGSPCFWMSYLAVQDADATAAACTKAGGQVFKPPMDIPNVGRFAILADPQGAAFGILQPLPGGQGGAFGMEPGKAAWIELRTPDPQAALAFYGKLFGWTVSRGFEMGPMGTYHILHHAGADIGGVFTPAATMPAHWLPYFSVVSANAAPAAIAAAGGSVSRGPDEVPGGAFTIQGTDPQGIPFAVVGMP